MNYTRKVWIARCIAVAVDILQIGVAPFVMEGFLSPFDLILDLATAVTMIWLLGWHVAFVPTFIVKTLPFADLAPTWTIAVLMVTGKSAQAAGVGAISSPSDQVPKLEQ